MSNTVSKPSELSESALVRPPTARVSRVWGIVSAILGFVVIATTYASEAITFTWIEAHPELDPDLNNPTSWLLGAVGMVLIIGGLLVGLPKSELRLRQT